MTLRAVELGTRIVILGCSCSGKSTLAQQLASSLEIPVIHLDWLAHYHDTSWDRKSDEELIEAHRVVIGVAP